MINLCWDSSLLFRWPLWGGDVPLLLYSSWGFFFLQICSELTFSLKYCPRDLPWRWQLVCDWSYGAFCADCGSCEWRGPQSEGEADALVHIRRLWRIQPRGSGKAKEQPEEMAGEEPHPCHRAGRCTGDAVCGWGSDCRSALCSRKLLQLQRDHSVPHSGPYSRTSLSFPVREAKCCEQAYSKWLHCLVLC